MKYKRILFEALLKNIGKKPIMVLYGARQVGKTTLIKTLLGKFSRTLYLQGDDPKDASLLEHKSSKELSQLVSGYELVVIDEAQRIKDIGTTLKLLADNVAGVQVLATGSSSFELANKLSEPLTGRNRKFHLYPLSLKEPVDAHGQTTVQKSLEGLLTFGMYPQVICAVSRKEKQLLIKELTGDYLFKDLFFLGDIRNSFAFEKLAKLLALRVGSEISYSELAKEVGISRNTVYGYMTLLEQAFITFRLFPLYTNKTKEINKSHKIYFYDTGVRNALIGNMDPLELRLDKGAIFENFFIAEKVKERSYKQADPRGLPSNSEIHFWKSRQGGEIDFVESTNANKEISAYECKWQKKVTMPGLFKKTYPDARFKSITMENIVEHFTGLAAQRV